MITLFFEFWIILSNLLIALFYCFGYLTFFIGCFVILLFYGIILVIVRDCLFFGCNGLHLFRYHCLNLHDVFEEEIVFIFILILFFYNTILSSHLLVDTTVQFVVVSFHLNMLTFHWYTYQHFSIRKDSLQYGLKNVPIVFDNVNHPPIMNLMKYILLNILWDIK